MFKLYQTIPTANDSIETICDYMEYKSIVSESHRISITSLVKEFVRPSDELPTSGIQDEQDKILEKLGEVEFEISRRIEGTNSRYPFELIDKSNVLRFKAFNSMFDYLYVYLLFATRLNMKVNKTFNQVDGTLLFEHISADTSKEYFGANSKSVTFGTSVDGGFKGKIEKLCKLINEGNSFENKSGGSVTEQDGTLDFFTYIDFNDKRPSKLIAFGQSKTGTEWQNGLTQLQPQNFCSLWFSRMPSYIPIRMYFVADVPENQNWYKTSSKSGILFDRLRILNYAPSNFETGIETKIKKWTNAAIESAKQFTPLKSRKKRSKK